MPTKNSVSNQEVEELLELYQTLKESEGNPVLKLYQRDLEWILRVQSPRKWSHRKFKEANERLIAQGAIKTVCRGVVVVLKERSNE